MVADGQANQGQACCCCYGMIPVIGFIVINFAAVNEWGRWDEVMNGRLKKEKEIGDDWRNR